MHDDDVCVGCVVRAVCDMCCVSMCVKRVMLCMGRIHPIHLGEPALPVINPGAVGVVRCKDCRGYINPFVRFMDGGSRWACNLCGLSNDVPAAYFSSIDATGKRADIATGEERRESSVACTFGVVS